MTDIELGDLASRAIRASRTPGGIKRIALNQYKNIQSSDGGFLGFLVDVAGKFFGFVCSVIFQGASWSLSTIWSWIVTATQFIWNFDWAQSDDEMNASLNTAWQSFGGILGGALGGSLGWLITGTIGGVILFQLNEAMAVYALDKFGEEALEEIAGKAASVIQATSRLLGKALFTWAYQALRGSIIGRESDIYLSDEDLKTAVESGKMTQETADKNKKGREALKSQNKRKPWSFALKWEEFVEGIDNEFIKQFIEEFWEEFWEGVQEGGYLLVNSVDSFYTQNQMANTSHHSRVNQTRVVSVQLNRNSEEPAAT
jgi:hypothetical protein